jgi:O-antigen ligase
LTRDTKAALGALLDRTYPLLVAATLFGFPVISTAPVGLGLSSRLVNVPYRVAVVAGTVAWCAVAALLHRPLIERRFRWCIGILAVMLLLRMFWDMTIVPLPIELKWDDLFMQALGIALLPVLPFLFTVDHMPVIRAQRLCLWVGLLASVAIAVGALLSIRAYAGGRLETDVLNPVTIGATGVSVYVVASSLSVPGKFLIFMGRALGALAGIGLCLLSASKGPLLGLLAVIALQFAVPGHPLSRSQKAMRITAFLALVTLATGAVLWLSGSAGFALYNRLQNVSSDPGVAARRLLWRGAIEQFDRSPILGDSFVEATLRFYPHNAFLEVMMTTGIIGLLLLIVVVLVGSVSAFRTLRDPGLRWIGLLFVQQVLAAQTSGSLYLSQAFWAALLMVISVDARANRLAQRAPSTPNGGAALVEAHD